MIQSDHDDLPDTFSYLGNTDQGILSADGMVVFGFGRADGAKPQIKTLQTFVIGFFQSAINNENDHQKISKYIDGLYN
ncbi:MAG: hypothetical protein IPL46_00175 [Saprospiraceae bacterium]|nr:hypothetical protein [Saprospiraceae bacterium]